MKEHHTYLLEPGKWQAQGKWYDRNGESVNLEGVTTITHGKDRWEHRGSLRLLRPVPVSFENVYEVKPFEAQAQSAAASETQESPSSYGWFQPGSSSPQKQESCQTEELAVKGRSELVSGFSLSDADSELETLAAGHSVQAQTEWKSVNRSVGRLTGRYALVKESILSIARSESGYHKSFEYLRKVNKNVYHSRGALFIGDNMVSSWAMVLRRDTC